MSQVNHQEASKPEDPTATMHPWEVEDDQLARQCEDMDPWNQFWQSYPKKSRKFSDMGLFVAMFLCMASAMLRIKSR